MASTDVTNTLIANITSTEQSTSNVDINRSTGSPAIAAAVAQFVTYASIANIATNVPLPISPTCQGYIKNIDPIKSVTVTWTPNGGAAVLVKVLYPGDQIIWWDTPGNTQSGITSLSLQASANFCLVEYFLGG